MSRSKGNKAEREVAALLQAWWRTFEPEATFIRTPLSGGWVQGRDLFDARGDLLVKNAPRFPWTVEIKRREQWSLQQFEDGKPSPVWSWWLQAANDAAKARRKPMLWFRHNRSEWIVMVSKKWITTEPDFEWSFGTVREHCLEPEPVGYWADKFLATHPLSWLV